MGIFHSKIFVGPYFHGFFDQVELAFREARQNFVTDLLLVLLRLNAFTALVNGRSFRV